jgi:hypothetical protein
MKINITIEATPEEVRETMGLPNFNAIQNILMGKLTEKIKEGSMDASSFMELVNPKMNTWGKLFMDAALKNLEIMTMVQQKNEGEVKRDHDQASK